MRPTKQQNSSKNWAWQVVSGFSLEDYFRNPDLSRYALSYGSKSSVTARVQDCVTCPELRFMIDPGLRARTASKVVPEDFSYFLERRLGQSHIDSHTPGIQDVDWDQWQHACELSGASNRHEDCRTSRAGPVPSAYTPRLKPRRRVPVPRRWAHS
jgi:hypothetical protein